MKNSNQGKRDARHDNRSHDPSQSHEPRESQGRFTDNRDQNYEDSRAYNEENYARENFYSGRNRDSGHDEHFGGNSGGGRGEDQGQDWGFGRSWNINQNSVRGENNSENGTRGSRSSGYENQSRERNQGYGGNGNGSTYGSQSSERNQSNGGFFGSSSHGEHKGKGPKGYERSDERIQETINDQLSDDDQLDASEIEVKVEKGEVSLSGTVSEKSDKRRAEDIVEAISGVKHVENRIRISSQNGHDSKSNGSGSSSNGRSGNSLSGVGSERSKNK